MPRGVLHPRQQNRLVRVTSHEPSAEAAPFVENYWHVHWRVEEPFETKVLTHPNVHLVFEEPQPLVYGVDRGLFVRRLENEGQALGIKFRPGGFRSFTDGPIADLTDRRIPATEFFGPEIIEIGRAVLAAEDKAALAEEFLLPRLPEPAPAAQEVAAMVERMTTDPTLFRVDQAATVLSVSSRTLQRLFAEYVGVGPKWVLRRARLQEAAARVDENAALDWAALAFDLGYADQSHFTRDFTAAVGTPPTAYARA